MKLIRIVALTSFVVLCAMMLSGMIFGQDVPQIRLERADFIKEVSTGQPSTKTLWYDAAIPGSYRPIKTDVAQGLNDIATAQGQKLKAVLIVGSGTSPSNIAYFVYAFTESPEGIQVNQTTFATSRFTYKSTGKLSPVQFKQFLSGLLNSKFLHRGAPPAELEESKYEFLLADWSGDKPVSYYGAYALAGKDAKFKDFSQLIGDLLHSLIKTFPVMPSRPNATPLPTPRPTPKASPIKP
jgi:hypothetical protein